MDKAKALLWTIRTCGLASLIVFVLVKGRNINPRYLGISSLLQRMCPQEDWLRYGNLYGQTQIAQFKILLPDEKGPALVSAPSADADKPRVFVLGDSFMTFRRGHETYVQSLSERLHEPIHFEALKFPRPACFRRLPKPLDKSRKQLVIMERTESGLLGMFSDVKECPSQTVEDVRSTRSLSAFVSRLFDLVFADDEQGFRAIFAFSRLTRPVAEALFTLRFSLFGAISEQCPVYSLNPPFLFLRQETDHDLPSSFYQRHDDALIGRLADNIVKVRDALKPDANTEFVFMPVPGKYTVYHVLLNNDPYDRFLPRLCDAVERKGVRTVRLYEKFAAEPGFTFYPTDSHWTPRGNEIALDETMKVLHDLRWR